MYVFEWRADTLLRHRLAVAVRNASRRYQYRMELALTMSLLWLWSGVLLKMPVANDGVNAVAICHAIGHSKLHEVMPDCVYVMA